MSASCEGTPSSKPAVSAPDDEVAEEEGGEDDARHAQRAERGDDDPRVAEARPDALGQLVADPGHLARAGHAGDRAADERRPQQQPLDADPGEPGRLGVEPDRALPQPVAVRASTNQATR